MAKSVDEIIYDLTHVAPGVNPFLWLERYLYSYFIPQYSHSAKVQLNLIVALHALSVLILLTSFVLRYRKGQFWLFRWQLSAPRLIVPNLATVPALAAIVEIAFFEVLLVGVVDMLRGRIPDSYGYSILLVGVLPAIVGEYVTWSIAAAFILHLHKSSGSTRGIRRWTLACNILGISIPILHLACFLPINILVGEGYREAIDGYRTIVEFLQHASTGWTPSDGFDLAALLPLGGIFSNLQEDFLELRILWRIAYCFHAASDVLLILALGTIATLYLNSVGRVIRRARQEVNEAGRGGETTLARVQQTWTLLVVVLSMFLLLASFSLCLSLYAAVHPLETPQGYVFTSFWSSAILTMLCSSLLLVQTCVEGSSSSSTDDEEKSAGLDERVVTIRSRTTVRSAATRTRWWARLFGSKGAQRSARDTGTRGRMGAASISVMVEIFSRIDTIEEPEEFGEEFKPGWTGPTSIVQ